MNGMMSSMSEVPFCFPLSIVVVCLPSFLVFVLRFDDHDPTIFFPHSSLLYTNHKNMLIMHVLGISGVCSLSWSSNNYWFQDKKILDIAHQQIEIDTDKAWAVVVHVGLQMLHWWSTKNSAWMLFRINTPTRKHALIWSKNFSILLHPFIYYHHMMKIVTTHKNCQFAISTAAIFTCWWWTMGDLQPVNCSIPHYSSATPNLLPEAGGVSLVCGSFAHFSIFFKLCKSISVYGQGFLLLNCNISLWIGLGQILIINAHPLQQLMFCLYHIIIYII